ncbi:glycerophosphodiester phosphodiesterase family protein [Foetidibacter luteolus]
MPALQQAIERGYKMIEIDVRLTKDCVLITQHDAAAFAARFSKRK